MGRGPSENANDGRRKLFDWEAAKETGTLAQFLKLRRYKKAVVSQTSPIPVGEHPELDSLEDVLKAGAKVAFRAQIAIFLPCLVGMVLFLASFGVMAGVIGALAADGMESQDIVMEVGYLVQVLMIFMVIVCVMLPASLQPSDVTGITLINGGVATSMIGCAFVLCPVLMPFLFPDESGGSRLSYSICGYAKCVLLSLTCFYSLIFLPPRRALRLAEIGLSSVGFGFVPFAVWAAISSVNSAGLEPTTGFYVSWAITACLCISFAMMALLGYPRTLSKRILRCLNAWLIPDVSEEANVLHATIATMVGSPFRAVASDALSKLRCVSLADVTLEEFSFNRPDPQCYLKSKECKFKEIDFFVSHSWSDNSEVKWGVIQRVREEFKAQNGGREPLIWFDNGLPNPNPNPKLNPNPKTLTLTRAGSTSIASTRMTSTTRCGCCRSTCARAARCSSCSARPT